MNRTFSWAAWAVSLLAGILSGCAGVPTSPAAGQTPEFAAGFADGCDSGRKAQGSPFYFYRKDAARFAADPQYAQGWSDGYQKCEYLQTQQNAAGNGGH